MTQQWYYVIRKVTHADLFEPFVTWRQVSTLKARNSEALIQLIQLPTPKGTVYLHRIYLRHKVTM